MAAVILRNAVITPKIRLAETAKTVQPGLQLLHDVDIKIHLPLHSMQKSAGGEIKNLFNKLDCITVKSVGVVAFSYCARGIVRCDNV